MHDQLASVLDALATVTAQGHRIRNDRPLPAAWDEEQVTQTIWLVLSELKRAGCSVFPLAGTLLGLERDGGLLPNEYGDWRTPRPEWDSLVSCTALQKTNLSWRCWALKNLCDRWLTGDLLQTRGLLEQILARGGADPDLTRNRDCLDASLQSAGAAQR